MKRYILAGAALLVTFVVLSRGASTKSAPFPDPAVDDQLAPASSQRSVVVAGGCFWGIQAVFQHVKGVSSAMSGYSGGTVKNPSYEAVCTGRTGHAESVRVVYDPSQVSFGQLLKVFFSVAHDPTEVNRQGPDTGTQYRSIIFYENADQQKIARAYIEQLDAAKTFRKPIATQLVPLDQFYQAEGYHQDYATKHPYEPYIAINDLPKVDHLQKQLPDLYRK
ncbi:MAG TPA: peptide-methionine (S)-S-oxide reductase MsrA [Vicinamibacterales bacterium]|nr:peptide-methionine (S)-S-oxide reductase MsrA [Vicinamibacterales bacterium]